MTLLLAGLYIFAGLVFAAAFQQDLTRRVIPNTLPAAIAVIGACKWIVVGRLADAVWAVGIAGIVLLVTGLMFWRGWMGGGDVKLLTATSFMFGKSDTLEFIWWTSLIGGIVAIIVMLHSRLYGRAALGGGSGNAVPAAKATVPYGVAISLAAVWLLFKQLR